MRTRSTAARATFALAMAVGLLTMAVVSSPAGATPTASAGSQLVHRGYTRTIEPFYPGHEATSPPSVLPTVACVRRVGRGQLEAVFGWDNPGPLSQEAPLDYGLNEILHRKGDTTTDQSDGPQAEEFLPGHHPYAWALRFPAGEVPSWQLVVPPLDQTQGILLWMRHGDPHVPHLVRPERSSPLRGRAERPHRHAGRRQGARRRRQRRVLPTGR